VSKDHEMDQIILNIILNRMIHIMINIPKKLLQIKINFRAFLSSSAPSLLVFLLK
jgi:hypothetical protein